MRFTADRIILPSDICLAHNFHEQAPSFVLIAAPLTASHGTSARRELDRGCDGVVHILFTTMVVADLEHDRDLKDSERTAIRAALFDSKVRC